MAQTNTVHVFGFLGSVSIQEIKTCLERHTGPNSIHDIQVKMSDRVPRSFAYVKFKDPRSARKIIRLAKDKKLYHNKSYLTAREYKSYVGLHRSLIHQVQAKALFFGCQISNELFHTLWRVGNIRLEFGFKHKKLVMYLSHDFVEYKLQLANNNIWKIRLHRSNVDENGKYLVIQLFTSPRIFKKVGGPSHNYGEEFQEEQWERTTDFTKRIGQSSALCIQFPENVWHRGFGELFAHYEDTRRPLNLENGIPFCRNTYLAPILEPGRSTTDLPFNVLYKICALVQDGCLPGPSLTSDFYDLVNPKKEDIKNITYALEELAQIKECCYNPVAWLKGKFKEYKKTKYAIKTAEIQLDEEDTAALVRVHRVLVTPTKVYFTGPELLQSNRVLRHFIEDSDRFLRVSFVDEDWGYISPIDLVGKGDSPETDTIYDRILWVLQNGVEIGDKSFQFLAFSTSQLRENSCWMFAPKDDLDTNDIRDWMGDFQNIRNVAKYAARLGQSFSTSKETLSVPIHEVEIVPDIKVQGSGVEYNFSDGIGKISGDFAQKIALKCGLSRTPSAFQVRYGGFKGVVAVDPYSSTNLSLRKSMLKFNSENKKLDVLAWSQYQPSFLNRQIITLLSTLGVEDEIFLNMQAEQIAQLNAILTDPLKAFNSLALMAPGENTETLKAMLNAGYKPDEEPFLRMMLENFRATKLQDLRTKARIFVPRGRSMMGCLDETGTLEYGEVFVQFSSPARSQILEGLPSSTPSSALSIVEGHVAVAKNPCLHPGDVRILKAVDAPALRHLVDCVVFPQKGHRPHPNECSGSDLDGDIYFVTWDLDLLPPSVHEPMNYNSPRNQEMDHDVTIEEVQKYFVDSMLNDTLGMIANAHVVFADREPDQAMSEPCLQLAALFSLAVDFPKTGVPAEIPLDLRVKEYPDFMEKTHKKSSYESKRVLGKLFRKVKDISPRVEEERRSFSRKDALMSYDTELEVKGFGEYILSAFFHKQKYDFKLCNLMGYYGIKTEAEILSGGVLQASRFFDRRKDTDVVAVAVRSLRREVRSWFHEGSQNENVLAKASAWYHVTYHPQFVPYSKAPDDYPHLISFPWCIHEKLIEIKRSRMTQNAEEADN